MLVPIEPPSGTDGLTQDQREFRPAPDAARRLHAGPQAADR
jgi:hypothetical protein